MHEVVGSPTVCIMVINREPLDLDRQSSQEGACHSHERPLTNQTLLHDAHIIGLLFHIPITTAIRSAVGSPLIKMHRTVLWSLSGASLPSVRCPAFFVGGQKPGHEGSTCDRHLT